MSSNKQTGTLPGDRAATPFSSRDGKPEGQGTTIDRPADLLGKPNGSGDSTPPRDPLQSVPQRTADEEEREPYIGPADRSRAQIPGSVEQRVNPTTIARGGPTIADSPSVARSGTGSVGSGARPFRNLK